MNVHRIVCDSVDDHIRRSIAEGNIPWTIAEVMAEWAAERALVGELPEGSDPITAAKARDEADWPTPRSFEDVMGPPRFVRVVGAGDRLVGESESMDREMAGGR